MLIQFIVVSISKFSSPISAAVNYEFYLKAKNTKNFVLFILPSICEYSSFTKDAEEVSADPVNQESEIATYSDSVSNSRFMVRRGSKSLPASPLGSPKTMRRSQNPYFTGTFAIVNQTAQNNGGETRGWLLSSLLGMQRETMSSTTSVASSHISEEGEDAHSMQAKGAAAAAASKFVKAKPSELREMNFWTPTSM